jgi:acyl-CoA synthetase (AMP-forming)/AMP-acid ligase II
VVTLVSNSREAVWVSLGILLAGGCEVTLNPAQGRDEQQWCTNIVAPVAIVHDGPAPDLPGTTAPLLACDQIESDGTLGGLNDSLPQSQQLSGGTWGRILFTSGTTGRPKGVVHTHFGRWLAALLLRHGIASRIQGESTLLMTPYSHGASLLSLALALEGAPVHLVPGVEPAVVGSLIRRGAVAHVFAPPTVLMKLVGMFRSETIATVRTIFTGTAPLSADLYEEVRRIFGPCIRVTYGMTEIFNPITVLDPVQCDRLYREQREKAAGLVGWPAPGVSISVRDDDNREVAEGEAGQIFVHAPHMYAGYLRDGGRFEPATSFHPTGDIGTFSSPHGLRLLGRMHDTIKTGGYKVLPDEIEVALRERGLTGEFVVVGIPSEHWGEVIVCAQAAADDVWVHQAEVAAAPMARYKQPRLFVTVPQIWKNAIGKIDRARVRDFVDAHFELKDGPYPTLYRRHRSD